MKLNIKVTPNAKRSELISFEDDCLKLKIKAPAQDGKANKELIQFLSDLLRCRKNDIILIRGETNRNKVIELSDELYQKLLSFTH